MIKHIKRTALATLAAVCALSSPVKATGNHQDHVRLWSALQKAGVTTQINRDCDGGYLGYYSLQTGILQICQTGRSVLGSQQVDWSEEDYDTLRHEAVHVLQDCLEGGIMDGRMGFVFEESNRKDFVTKALSSSQIMKVIKMYTNHGASEDVIIRELEAFAIAAVVSPVAIAESIDTHCKA